MNKFQTENIIDVSLTVEEKYSESNISEDFKLFYGKPNPWNLQSNKGDKYLDLRKYFTASLSTDLVIHPSKGSHKPLSLMESHLSPKVLGMLKDTSVMAAIRWADFWFRNCKLNQNNFLSSHLGQ